MKIIKIYIKLNQKIMKKIIRINIKLNHIIIIIKINIKLNHIINK